MGELTDAPGNASLGDLTPKQLLSRFYALQEERVETYNLFEEGFQAYLNGAPNYNFPLYRQLVHEITDTFNKISKDIVQIKEKFAGQNNLIPLSEIIGQIQTSEQTKLEQTVKLQLLRQKQKDEPSETVDSEVEDTRQSMTVAKSQLVEYMEDLKYESEDLYTADIEPEPVDSTLVADR
ncbi:required for excision 1-B domain-containing protein-like [Mya arenaria]|uniref:required for excision 1-B domain-containing protein-like n=1 Tax=Mya arenaria TaxID=6604 RepID=UPI0022E96560|nr:required for excision 1-B domain-containing protein-like [Mya arenaria]